MLNNKRKFHWWEVPCTLFFAIIPILFLWITWGKNEVTYENIGIYLASNGQVVVFAFFYLIIFVYSIIYIIRNIIIKPKQTILYLKKEDKNKYYFIDMKGHSYIYKDLNNNYKIDTFYDVLKTRNIIFNIIGISQDKFKMPEKNKNYWFNFYLPFGKFENVLILPVIYAIMIGSLVAILFLDLTFIIPLLITISTIIYDAKYKKKKNKIQKDIDKVEDKNLKEQYLNKIDSASELTNMEDKAKGVVKNTAQYFALVITFISCLAALIILILLGIKSNNNIVRIAFIPFIIIDSIYLMQTIVHMIDEKKGGLNYSKIESTFSKYITIFSLIFIYSFLIIMTYLAIREKAYPLLFIIFIMALASTIIFKFKDKK